MPLDLSDYVPASDLAVAETMPSRWHTDPAFLELEKQNVFWKTWQPVGRVDDVLRPGDFFTYEVAGEPIVVTRGLDHMLRACYNVCLHRASGVGIGEMFQEQGLCPQIIKP